jgi:hypothetical protein
MVSAPGPSFASSLPPPPSTTSLPMGPLPPICEGKPARELVPLLPFNSRRRRLAHSHRLLSSRQSSPRQRGGSYVAPVAPKISPTSRSRAWVKRRAGGRWVLAVTRAEPIRPLIRGSKRWSGASPSRGELEGRASAVSSVATKLAHVGSPSVAFVAIVWVTRSVTVIVNLQSTALLHLEAALQLLVLLALHSLRPGPRLCAHRRHQPRHPPLLELTGMPLSLSFRTPTCRPSLVLYALSSSSLLRIASKR